ncbi:MAG TPA: hypothetical protein VFG64_08975 [Dongiaceae bacterium]|nr:hypothetical protein [Dongiaceae bacterium]
MTTHTHDTHAGKTRTTARVAPRPGDRELAIARHAVLAAGFLVLLAALLTHIGG